MVNGAISLEILNEIIIIIQDMGLRSPAMDEETLIVRELGFDSGQLVELYSEIEKIFGVPISPDDDLNTIGDLVCQIEEAVHYVESLTDTAPHGIILH